MKKLISFVLLLFSLNYLIAQKHGSELIDSLKSRLNSSLKDTSTVRLMGKLSFQYYKFDTDSGIYFAQKAISMAKELKWNTGVAFSLNYLGTNYAVKGNYPRALECFEKSLSVYKEIGDQQGVAFLSNNLGNFHRIQKNYVKAKEYIEEALAINLTLNNKIDLTKNYDNLGCIYYETSEYLKSESCYEKALAIAEEINNQDLVAQLLINVAENKVKTKDYCGALESAIKAVKIGEELNIPYDGAVYNGYVGEIYLKLSEEDMIPSGRCTYISNIQQINLISAKEYLNKSITLLDKVADLSLLSENSLLLSKVYEKLGDSGNALRHYKIYSSSKDSIASTDQGIQLANLEKIKEVELRDNKIKIQTLEIRHQRSQMSYQIILFLLMLIVISFILYSYYKTKMAMNLSASEEKYRTIFENLQDIFYQIDLDGIILDISPSIENFSEYSRDDLIGKPVYEYYTNPNERDSFIKAIKAKGEIRDWEINFKTKSGTKYASINARLICDPDGTPIHINGAMRDITERKQFEAQLKESKEKYHKDLVILNSIFESPVNIIMFALDRNYCYTAFTRFHKKTIKAIWGIDIQIGMNMIDLISNEEDKKKAKSNFDRALAGEHFIETEEYGDNLLLRTFYEDYYSSVKNVDGAIVGVSVFVIDVSHRKLAEKQLELLIKAIEQSPVTVLITNKSGIIEYVNPNFTDVTGYSTDEVMGQNPRILQSDSHSKEFYKELWSTILSGKNWIGEFRNKKKNGEFYDESTIISPIVNPDGQISHFVAVKTDITEKKIMMEDLIQAKEQAEESDNLKTAFLNNVSHEIRTPLNGLLGFLSILQMDILSDDERAQYNDYINKSAGRLMNTINEIVEISQIQTGQTKLTLSEISMRKFTSDLGDLFYSEIENQGILFSLQNEIPEGVDTIISDYSKLISILSNLISNAIKFTTKGSIEVNLRKNDHFLEFQVSDTGIGIAEDKQSIIFERFIQADNSRTRKFEGPGLGLAISKAYAEMLNGRIEVNSQLGRGSVFCLYIPCQTRENKIGALSTNFPLPKGRIEERKMLNILIAEDDEQSARLVKIMVKNWAISVEIAVNGVDAVKICRSNPDIDLVLMDIKMPIMDGYEATRHIRQFNMKIIIIAQTAYALAGDMEKAIEAGCNDYISKPIHKERLLALIQKYFHV